MGVLKQTKYYIVFAIYVYGFWIFRENLFGDTASLEG
jgi:hypothetical protein